MCGQMEGVLRRLQRLEGDGVASERVTALERELVLLREGAQRSEEGGRVMISDLDKVGTGACTAL